VATIRPRVERSAQLGDDPVLEREEITDRAVRLDSRRQGAGRRIDQTCGYAHPVAQPLIAAGNDPRGAEPKARFARRPFRVTTARPRPAGGSRRHLVDQRIAPDDRDLVETLEVGRQRFRDARADPVVGRPGRDVDEWSDGHRCRPHEFPLHRCSGAGCRLRERHRRDNRQPRNNAGGHP
jgi:hypothetical protein